MTLKYANTQAFSGSQDNHMASKLYKLPSYKHAGLLKILEPCITYQTPTNLRTGVVLQRESNIKSPLTSALVENFFFH